MAWPKGWPGSEENPVPCPLCPDGGARLFWQGRAGDLNQERGLWGAGTCREGLAANYSWMVRGEEHQAWIWRYWKQPNCDASDPGLNRPREIQISQVEGGGGKALESTMGFIHELTQLLLLPQ